MIITINNIWKENLPKTVFAPIWEYETKTRAPKASEFMLV